LELGERGPIRSPFNRRNETQREQLACKSAARLAANEFRKNLINDRKKEKPRGLFDLRGELRGGLVEIS